MFREFSRQLTIHIFEWFGSSNGRFILIVLALFTWNVLLNKWKECFENMKSKGEAGGKQARKVRRKEGMKEERLDRQTDIPLLRQLILSFYCYCECMEVVVVFLIFSKSYFNKDSKLILTRCPRKAVYTHVWKLRDDSANFFIFILILILVFMQKWWAVN